MHLHHIYFHSMDRKFSLNDYNKSKCKSFGVLLGPMSYCSIVKCTFVVLSLPPSCYVLAGAGFLCNTAALLSTVMQTLLEARFGLGGIGHFKQSFSFVICQALSCAI